MEDAVSIEVPMFHVNWFGVGAWADLDNTELTLQGKADEDALRETQGVGTLSSTN